VKCNVGKTEQFVRISIGAIAILLGIYFRSWWGLLGLLPIITGAVRYCPISDLMGISTCREKKRQ
jgi:hypothetical protein